MKKCHTWQYIGVTIFLSIRLKTGCVCRHLKVDAEGLQQLELITELARVIRELLTVSDEFSSCEWGRYRWSWHIRVQKSPQYPEIQTNRLTLSFHHVNRILPILRFWEDIFCKAATHFRCNQLSHFVVINNLDNVFGVFLGGTEDYHYLVLSMRFWVHV